MVRVQRVALAAIVAAALAAPVAAQQNSQVSQADIQRLQDSVFQAGSDIQQLRSRDAARATQLQTQLDDLRDEVTYLKVKLRKEGSLQRTEYATVRDRLDDLRSQATNYTASYTPAGTNGATSASSATGATGANRAAGTSPSSTPTQSSTTTRSSSASTTTASGSGVEIPSGTELDV